MRQLVLSRRWIMWHVLTLGAVVTCAWLAAWQWQRAGSSMGSALNVGYGLQWPLFAVFFAVMWWRMLRMEAAKLQSDAAAELRSDAAAPASARPAAPRPAPAPPVEDEDDPELAAYNRMLAQLAARHADD